ncbi:gliding motility lipoprotein GldB [Bacteroides sp. 519]|uniref:gliding motility lipoprotein GldB n=1 Tax=Bacteroides sp. 519 TaxID=2302937 RepID=UPI0013D86145|nr:gliding motility lipoprotein GldB [Bacteroides sp. 519]NDV58934.1 gliding motility lipoprotein GldB [Bacteroides sp. 519]
MKLIILLLIPFLFGSCRMDKMIMEPKGDNEFTIIRYDRLQSEYVRLNSLPALQKMNTQYSRQTQILIEKILEIGQVSDDDINQKLLAFYSDTILLHIMEDVESKFGNLDSLDEELEKGFKKLKKEVPAIKIPQIYTQVSALNNSVVINDTLVGISLDKYLGQDYPLYTRYYYEYQTRSMRPDRIAPDCFVFYLGSYYPVPPTSRRTLLEIMIHFGKINYVAQQLLNYSSSEAIMGYSAEERVWCKENKKKVWEYLVSSKQLYATDPMVIRRYTRTYPYIDFFGENSPAQIGTWMGLEIVSSYMKHNKKVTLQQLLDMTDYNLLLDESDFKP